MHGRTFPLAAFRLFALALLVVLLLPMPASAGFCCNPFSGNCYSTIFNCNSGDYSVSSCSAYPCTGVCCSSSGGCTLTGGQGCNGNFMGSGIVCGQVPCNGACCSLISGQCSMTGPGNCSGQFIAVGSTCPLVTCQAGACCDLSTGGCAMTGPQGCSGAAYRGNGSVCGGTPCLGACCNSTTGACTHTPAQGCAVGVFQGLGTLCASTSCPQVACCNSTSGLCQMSVNGACPNGAVLAPTTTNTCSPTPCTGACCNRWTGHCVVRELADCASSGLRFNGFGASCSAATCWACPADFNGSGAVTIDDIFIFLNAWFTGCP